MNFFSFLSFFVFSVYILLGFYVINIDKKSNANRLFLIFCLCVAVWAFAYTFIYPGNNSQFIWFWYKVSAIGWCLFPSVSLHQMLFQSKRIYKFNNIKLILLIYTPAIVFYIKVLSGNLISVDFIDKPYGTAEVFDISSPWFWLYVAFFSIYPVVGLSYILQWGRKTKFKIEKKQSTIFFWSGIIVLILGSVVNIILPALKIYFVPAIAPIICILWFSSMTYAIIKYGMLKLNSGIAMEEIVSNILDAIIITDPDGNIIKINSYLEKLLDYKENELTGKPINMLIPENQIGLIEYRNLQQDLTSKMGWEINCFNKKGEPIPFSFYKIPVYNRYEDRIGIIFIGRDLRLIKLLENEINERQQAEFLLKSANENLEAKVLERTKELELYATTDTMTGIYNRRAGLLMLEKEMQRAKRERTNLTICFIDIDNLKLINDSYGHMEGDSLIMTVAGTVKESLRESDIICRMGGDEFLLILPRCTISQSKSLWKIIQKKIEFYNIENQKDYQVRISYGFSEFNHQNPLNLDELISIADMEMYQNKKNYKMGKKQ